MNGASASRHGSPSNRSVALDPSVTYLCQRCTNCCRWPGDVRLDEEEIPRIAAFLGMDEQTFIRKFTRLRANRTGLSLIEKDNHECVMLDGNSCRIHDVKPTQCAGFPNQWNFPGWRDVCEAIPMPTQSTMRAHSPGPA
jgi:Fe-S-cluster containining protein